MSSQVLDPVKAAALDLLATGVDAVLDAGVAPFDSADARTLITELETQTRRLRCEQIDLLTEIDRRDLHRPDGHASAKLMMAHVVDLSGGEAGRRASSARALRTCQKCARRCDRGGSGAARWNGSRRRIRTRGCVTWWWPTTRRSRRRPKPSGTADIFDHFYEAETLTDWAEARARLGETATKADLARTDAQRRSDASLEIFRQAAGNQTATSGSKIVTTVVIDQATFERMLHEFFGGEPEPVDPPMFGDPLDPYRCSTLDGWPVEPTEAVANALIGQVRRAIVGADRVVTDLGRLQRLFAGSPALAVRLSATECYWPGCHVPVSNCQIDHLDPWTDRDGRGGGSTNPGNGGPLCGRHNRLKEHGFTVWRDQALTKSTACVYACYMRNHG